MRMLSTQCILENKGSHYTKLLQGNFYSLIIETLDTRPRNGIQRLLSSLYFSTCSHAMCKWQQNTCFQSIWQVQPRMRCSWSRSFCKSASHSLSCFDMHKQQTWLHLRYQALATTTKKPDHASSLSSMGITA